MPSKTLDFSNFKNERTMSIYTEAKKYFKVKELRKKNKDFESKIKASEEKRQKEHERTLVQIQKSENLFIEEEKKGRVLQEENTKLKDALRKQREECERLSNLNNDLEKNLKNLRSEIKVLKSENVKLSVEKDSKIITTSTTTSSATATTPSALRREKFEEMKRMMMKEFEENFEKKFMKMISEKSSHQSEEGEPHVQDMEDIDMPPPQTSFTQFEEPPPATPMIQEVWEPEPEPCTKYQDKIHNSVPPSTTENSEPLFTEDLQCQTGSQTIFQENLEEEDEFQSIDDMIKNSKPSNGTKPTLVITSEKDSQFKYSEIGSFDSIFSSNNVSVSNTSSYPLPSNPTMPLGKPHNQVEKVKLPEGISTLKYGDFFKLIGDIDESKRACYSEFLLQSPKVLGEILEKIISPRYGQPFLFYITHSTLGNSPVIFSLMELLDFNVFGDTKEEIEELINCLTLINSDCREDIIVIVRQWLADGMSFKKYGYLKEKSKRD